MMRKVYSAILFATGFMLIIPFNVLPVFALPSTCENSFSDDFSSPSLNDSVWINRDDVAITSGGKLVQTTTSTEDDPDIHYSFMDTSYWDILVGDFSVKIDAYAPDLLHTGTYGSTISSITAYRIVDNAADYDNHVGVSWINGQVSGMYYGNVKTGARVAAQDIDTDFIDIGPNVDLVTFKLERVGNTLTTYYQLEENFILLDTIAGFAEDVGISIESTGLTDSQHTVTASYDNFVLSCVDRVTVKTAVVYRFFNIKNGAHLYTTSASEVESVLQLYNEWRYEGTKYTVLTEPVEGSVPVYRFWNSKIGSHLYTTSEIEKQTVMDTLPHFIYEGVKYHVYENQEEGTIPVYRFFNTRNGAHLYTTDENEKQTIMNTLQYFQFEGVKYYVL